MFFWEKNSLLNVLIFLQLGKQREALDFDVASHSMTPIKYEVSEAMDFDFDVASITEW
jgi:hypothetical protein